MRALRSAPIGLVFFLLTLTYIEVGNPEVCTWTRSGISDKWPSLFNCEFSASVRDA